MNLKILIQQQNWDQYPGPPHYQSAWVQTALRSLQAAGSEPDAARAVAELQDAAGNRHGSVLYPVTAPAAAVMIGIVELWRKEARAQALTSLCEIMQTEIFPGYETFEEDGQIVDAYEAIWRNIRHGLPILRSIANEKQPWQFNRILARQVIEAVLNPD